jgi:hypothetical protein
MNKEILNFVGTNPIEVCSMKMDGYNRLIVVKQYIGSCSFQHTMTADQARELANELLRLAGENHE